MVVNFWRQLGSQYDLQPDVAISAWFPSQISSYIDAVTALGTSGAHGAHLSEFLLTASQS